MAPDQPLQQIYDELAATYEAGRGAYDMAQVFDAFYRRLPPGGGHVLDLGCGAGEPMARLFIARGWCVTGVDMEVTARRADLQLATNLNVVMK